MKARPALAISLYVSGKSCVVVGDGDLAAARAARLREAGAHVTSIPADAYEPSVLKGAFVVFCLEPRLATILFQDAHAEGALVYSVDNSELSDMAMPAIMRHGVLTLAISTDGTAPALARRIREELERLVTEAAPDLDKLLAELAKRRQELKGAQDTLYRLARRFRFAGKIVVDPVLETISPR